MKQLIYLILGSLFFSSLGCTKDAVKRISIGVVSGWAEGEAMTQITQEILGEEGYRVVVQKAATNMIFASMNNGDTDAFMDVWLPHTHGDKVKLFDKIHSAGVNYNGAQIGLVVPDYVDINSIEELNDHKSEFDNGKIVAIERGSGIVAATDQAIKDYNLDYIQLNSSTVAMVSELQKAINEKRWIVITGWTPHWIFGRFKLKFLDDPKGSYGDAERIEIWTREDLDQDFPLVYHYFQNFHLEDDVMSDLLAQMESSKNKKKAAKDWVEEHRELVDSWLGK